MKKKYNREKILKECNDLITVKQFKRYIKKLHKSNQKGGSSTINWSNLGASGNIGTLIDDVVALVPGVVNVVDEMGDLFDYVSNDVSLNAGTTYTSGTFSGLN